MGADHRIGSDKQGPGDQAVEEVHAILRQIVGMVLNSPECSMLQRYIVLKREIATVAAASLEKVQTSHCCNSNGDQCKDGRQCHPRYSHLH